MNKIILIAESNSSFSAVLNEKLQLADYSTILVSSGKDVVSAVLESSPDLLLLALDINGRDGLEIMRDIKTRDETRDIAVVVISESGDPMEIEKAREIGASDFLIRAVFDSDDVIQKINKAVDLPVQNLDSSGEFKDLDYILTDGKSPNSFSKDSSADSSSTEHGVVMIIEDDKFLREGLYGRKLRDAGFQVEAVENGEQALKMLSMMTPDIIMLDLVLPGMDGFEILQKIREGEKTKNIPVIVVSNLGQQEDIDRVMKLGATDFMVKANFTLDEIAERIHSIIKAR